MSNEGIRAITIIQPTTDTSQPIDFAFKVTCCHLKKYTFIFKTLEPAHAWLVSQFDKYSSWGFILLQLTNQIINQLF